MLESVPFLNVYALELRSFVCFEHVDEKEEEKFECKLTNLREKRRTTCIIQVQSFKRKNKVFVQSFVAVMVGGGGGGG
jgi:hypothetical protein